jgi:hypothetical protein
MQKNPHHDRHPSQITYLFLSILWALLACMVWAGPLGTAPAPSAKPPFLHEHNCQVLGRCCFTRVLQPAFRRRWEQSELDAVKL